MDFSITIGDTVTVIPTTELGSGETVTDFVIAVEATATLTDGTDSSSLTEDFYLSHPEGVLIGVFKSFDDFTKVKAEKMIREMGWQFRPIDKLDLKFWADKNNATKKDAPWA